MPVRGLAEYHLKIPLNVFKNKLSQALWCHLEQSVSRIKLEWICIHPTPLLLHHCRHVGAPHVTTDGRQTDVLWSVLMFPPRLDLWLVVSFHSFYYGCSNYGRFNSWAEMPLGLLSWNALGPFDQLCFSGASMWTIKSIAQSLTSCKDLMQTSDTSCSY